MLTGPLRDRFQIRKTLEFYGSEDLTTIIVGNAKKLDVPIDLDAAQELARRSRGTPRVANNELLWVRDYAETKADGRITLDVAIAALKMNGIDELGLTPLDRKYLETLARVFGGGPAGIEAIAHTMNTSPDTLEDDVEPFLLRSELVVRTPRGRVMTANAYQHLKISLPKTEIDKPKDQGELF
jgi:Holliday junction DNA helicase RuvB